MRRSACSTCDGGNLGRRDFLRVGSLSLLGLGLNHYFQASEALAAAGATASRRKAEACILLWLEGGPSHVDTWDPKSNSNFKPIATNVDGIQVSELLPRTARHMDKIALVRSIQSKGVNHPQASYYTLTGHEHENAVKFPSFGSIVTKELGPRNDLHPYMLAPMPWEDDYFDYQDGFTSAFIGSQYDPMVLPDPSQEEFNVPDLRLPKSITKEVIDHRRSFLQAVDEAFRAKEQLADFDKMDAASQRALSMLMSPAVKKAFDMTEESEQTKDAYGRTRVGQSVLMARRLVEHGCRFVTASGWKDAQWDTHGDNDKRLSDNLTPQMDQSLAALLEDLDQRGLLETTVVLVMGEFGRTPDINPGGGRDHWPNCWSLAVAGGGIRGGQVIGASDEKGGEVADRLLSVGDVYATVFQALGIDHAKTYTNPIGRPVYIANALEDKQGQPIPELL